MLKKSALIVLLMFNTLLCYADYPGVKIYPDFVGGLNLENIASCNKKMQPFCHDSNNVYAYASCIKTKMVVEPECKQNLVLLNLDVPAFFDKIKHYQQIDVADVRVLYADKSSSYYIIDKKGELIDTDAIKPKLSSATNYQELNQKYIYATSWDITSAFPPKIQKLPNGNTQVIFERAVTVMCRACDIVATTTEGYVFDKNGQFVDVTLLKLNITK